jgi:hypothetical protein
MPPINGKGGIGGMGGGGRNGSADPKGAGIMGKAPPLLRYC